MEEETGSLDPETRFLLSKRKTGFEWELFKENVRPLKRGRNVALLNDALKSHSDHQLKKSLIHIRSRLIEAIKEYKGDDPLQPWIECIKWVQEAFPSGGDSSGLVVIYEQCVRSFWHSDRYKDDLRYLKVWLEYAENCTDAEVIYDFLRCNGIGQTHSMLYTAHALHLESKNKNRSADDVFNSGLSRNAQPKDKLEAAYREFLARTMRKPKESSPSTVSQISSRSFGTILAKRDNNRMQVSRNSDHSRRIPSANRGGGNNAIRVYEDTPSSIDPPYNEADSNTWSSLGTRSERNKENNPIPSKWPTYKIPQRCDPEMRSKEPIDVFVDEEYQEVNRTGAKESGSGVTTIGEVHQVKKETELLRKDPLRNFPQSALPR